MSSSEFPELESLRSWHREDEGVVVRRLLAQFGDLKGCIDAARPYAEELISTIRSQDASLFNLDRLLSEFSLTTDEGVALMCLAEALLRIPDQSTIDHFIQDRLSRGDWASHFGRSDSLFVNASAWGLAISGEIYRVDRSDSKYQLLHQVVSRFGFPVVRAAMRSAVSLLGDQFILGNSIQEAVARAAVQSNRGYLHSFDMLGEGARTQGDADRYFADYQLAIRSLPGGNGSVTSLVNSGISVKLSALHPRYEFRQRERVVSELVPKLLRLTAMAKEKNIPLTIDAEESERLILSLIIISSLIHEFDLGDWDGFGVAVQSYQKRALPVINYLSNLARSKSARMTVRLVKGAYWDSEIKWCQEGGYSGYPVFVTKRATDLNYLVCAGRLLELRDSLFPQFATHNAVTVSSILQLGRKICCHIETQFEFQRLQGMGESLYDKVIEDTSVPCRVYAPVGEHRELLAYLVRRLLENGANSSFVNQVNDKNLSPLDLWENPFEYFDSNFAHICGSISLPKDIFRSHSRVETERDNSSGFDLSSDTSNIDFEHLVLNARRSGSLESGGVESSDSKQSGQIQVVEPSDHNCLVGTVDFDTANSIERKLVRAHSRRGEWAVRSVSDRAKILLRLADLLEQQREELVILCCREAGKTIDDGIAEVREAVDFCRYYANAALDLAEEGNIEPLGVVLCISPWNFPLAIFVGQISAALSVGNAVIAKPAEQTCLVAIRVIELMVEAGVPADIVGLVLASGPDAGALLVADPRINGVMFTGSLQTAQWINRKLAERSDGVVPLVAETGGLNAMVADSTALPEQLVDDLIRSSFHSAGQRCSSLRVLLLQEDCAEEIIRMLIGAMRELVVGDPAQLRTDIGPIIDDSARQRLLDHCAFLDGDVGSAKLLYRCHPSEECPRGSFFAPRLYEIRDLSLLSQEVFGPVLHIIRYREGTVDSLLQQLNSKGFGLTFGVHSRIHSFCNRLAHQISAGNVYINRNMVGAVVGVQPFGGRGLSGTGPKAGGPHYLRRLVLDKRRYLPSALHTLKGFSSPLGSSESESASDIYSVQQYWQRTERLERLTIVDGCLPLLSDMVDHAIRDRGSQLFHEVLYSFPASMDLPGPVGESNRLVLESRGSIVMIWDGSSDSILKVLLAVLLGNGVVISPPGEPALSVTWFIDQLKAAGLPSGLVCSIESADLQPLLDQGDIAAVLAAEDYPGLQRLAGSLAHRPGAIVPLLVDPPGISLALNLVTEKTITVNETAFGGNVTLVSGG